MIWLKMHNISELRSRSQSANEKPNLSGTTFRITRATGNLGNWDETAERGSGCRGKNIDRSSRAGRRPGVGVEWRTRDGGYNRALSRDAKSAEAKWRSRRRSQRAPNSTMFLVGRNTPLTRKHALSHRSRSTVVGGAERTLLVDSFVRLPKVSRNKKKTKTKWKIKINKNDNQPRATSVFVSVDR